YVVARVTGCKNFSRARALAPGLVEAMDWGCTLRVAEPLPENLRYIGIRAHHVVFTDSSAASPIKTTSTHEKSLPESTVSSGVAARVSSRPVIQTGVPGEENTFPCWLAQTSETPFRMTLYLRLHAPALNGDDYHLQAEVFKEKW